MTRLTTRETEIMTVLWERGPSTVAEVRDALSGDPAYTTVLTLLRILEEKGHVARELEGRAHRYHAVTARQDARESAVRRVVRQFFRGSPELLLTQLVSDAELPRETLERLHTLLEERLAHDTDDTDRTPPRCRGKRDDR